MTPWRQQVERLVKGLLLVGLLGATLPALTGLIDLNVDSEWQMGLQTAAHLHVHWGPQMIWTFGPLGYLQYPLLLYPREWLITVVALLMLSVLFVIATGAFLRTCRAHLGWWTVVVGVLVLARGVTSGLELKLAVCMLVFTALAANRRLSSGVSIVCACVAGLAFAVASMVRGTELFVAELAVPCLVVAFMLGRRRPQAVAFVGAFLGGFIALWLAAGQWLGDIPLYLRGAWEISSGYSWQAAVAPLRAELAVSLLALVPVAAFVLLAFARRSFTLGVLAVASLILAVVAYKEGIVGGGPVHRLPFAVTIMLVLALLGSATAGRLARAAPIVAAAGIAFAWLFIAPSVTLTGNDWNTAPPGDGSPGAVIAAYRHYADLIVSATRRTGEIRVARARFQNQVGLSPATVASMRTGPTLFDPIDVGVAWAYQVPWAPGPVMQNYAAYTPWLQSMDAATLEGALRPAHVLLTADRLILGEWPQFQDAAAFRALMSNYHLSPVTLANPRPGILLFDAGGRTLPPPSCTLTLPAARFGDVITLPVAPTSSYLFMNVEPSLKGRLRALLVRGAAVHLDVRIDSGQWVPPHTLVIPSAANGLFVGGLVNDNQQMFELLTGRGGTRIIAVRLTTAYPADFGEPFSVSVKSAC